MFVQMDGNVVIMNPNNGDILAMATYPGYNLNDPYTINNEELKSIWNTLQSSERSNNLEKMWRNKAISDTYEPGSTFKLITASTALEEGLVKDIEAENFACNGRIEVAGVSIKCWRYYRPHGSESLRTGLMNSCNPVFIGLGQKLGVDTYFSYLEKFGLLSKTGVDLPGEANSIFIAKEKAGPVELATISFGQRFEVTPLQLVTAVSSIANGGNLIQPRVVKATIDSETGETQEKEPVILSKNVISKETSKNVLSMMESVVSLGTGKNAQVKGYSVGGKTGTSEDGVNTGKYVTSFCGVASISDPELVILITLYNPTGEGGHQGGGVAAPIGSQILSEVLPYLELKRDKEEELDPVTEVTVPNITNMNVKDAEKVLKDLGLQMSINVEEGIDISEMIITNQTPKEGITINSGTKIYCEIGT
ncbi:MAG: PASTA domain-containing protein [Clostridia bacterium]|nr:PASTA domain-containing protein [Clostridia bacterium]